MYAAFMSYVCIMMMFCGCCDLCLFRMECVNIWGIKQTRLLTFIILRQSTQSQIHNHDCTQQGLNTHSIGTRNASNHLNDEQINKLQIVIAYVLCCELLFINV